MFGFKSKNTTSTDYEKLGRALEKVLITDYLDFLQNTRRLLWSSFVRGLFAGFGGVLGATLMVGLLIYLLQALGGAPVIGEYIGEYVKDITETIQR